MTSLMFSQTNTIQQSKNNSEYIPQTIDEVNSLFRQLTPLSISNNDLIQNTPNMGFLKNDGQKQNQDIQFYYSSKQSAIAFSAGKIIIKQIQKDNSAFSFIITFPNSNVAKPVGKEKLAYTSNFIIGNQEFNRVNSFQEIWYNNLFKNIDLRYYITDVGLKYEFVVYPGGNPNDINIQVENDLSIDTLKILDDEVHYLTPEDDKGIIIDKNLIVYQNKKVIDDVRFIDKPNLQNTYGFEILSYNSDEELIIDPLLFGFSTIIGGSKSDVANSIATDDLGNIYVTGNTWSNDFPTINAYDETGSQIDIDLDIFVLKYNSTGNGLIYSTYIAGNSIDNSNSIAVDTSGNVYITGNTRSIDFPTTTSFGNGIDRSIYTDIFILKLNSEGNDLIFSTLIGGSLRDTAYSIAIDKDGNAFVTGDTESVDFPTLNAYDEFGDQIPNWSDMFIIKLNSTGNGLVYSTYISGRSLDYARSIAIDTSGNAYITGNTYSVDLPMKNSFDAKGDESIHLTDVFVLKLNSTGNGLVYSTYISGEYFDYGTSITVDEDDYAYVTGYTGSYEFPTVNPFQLEGDGTRSSDIFVFKLDKTGEKLIYSTYISGNKTDRGTSIIVDELGHAFITGFTSSNNFPVVKDNHSQSPTNDLNDIFITELNSEGNDLIYSSYFGGNSDDRGYAIAMDNSKNIYFSGYTRSPNIDNKLNETIGTETNLFIAKLNYIEEKKTTTQQNITTSSNINIPDLSTTTSDDVETATTKLPLILDFLYIIPVLLYFKKRRH